MEVFGVAGVAAITVIVYLLAMGLRITVLPSRWLPVICGAVGGALGAAAFLWLPISGFPADDLLTAVAVGIASGLAATGLDQIGKQIGKKRKE